MADSTFSTFSNRLWNVLSCLLVSSKTIYGSVSVGIHATAIPFPPRLTSPTEPERQKCQVTYYDEF